MYYITRLKYEQNLRILELGRAGSEKLTRDQDTEFPLLYYFVSIGVSWLARQVRESSI